MRGPLHWIHPCAAIDYLPRTWTPPPISTLSKQIDYHPNDPAHYGFTDADENRKILSAAFSEWIPQRLMKSFALKQTYCGSIGVDSSCLTRTKSLG